MLRIVPGHCHEFVDFSLSEKEIRRSVADAAESSDWREMLKWESRMDELAKDPGHDPEFIVEVLRLFAMVYQSAGKFEKASHMHGRCVDAWRALNKFSEEVQAIPSPLTPQPSTLSTKL
jgi:hypothetical protein